MVSVSRQHPPLKEISTISGMKQNPFDDRRSFHQEAMDFWIIFRFYSKLKVNSFDREIYKRPRWPWTLDTESISPKSLVTAAKLAKKASTESGFPLTISPPLWKFLWPHSHVAIAMQKIFEQKKINFSFCANWISRLTRREQTRVGKQSRETFLFELFSFSCLGTCYVGGVKLKARLKN